jgi:HPt (histidine-containing phosphotransfer) domain-containing protein
VGRKPAVHRRLIGKFLTDAREQVGVITLASAAGYCESAAEMAHSLKSSARTVGALRLGEWCDAVERAGRAGDAQACSASGRSLMEIFKQTDEKISASIALV